jgi:CBS domain-containing protein
MTTPAISIDEAMTIQDVASLFLRRKINQAPVLRKGKLAGIVSRGDLVSAIALQK